MKYYNRSARGKSIVSLIFFVPVPLNSFAGDTATHNTRKQQMKRLLFTALLLSIPILFISSGSGSADSSVFVKTVSLNSGDDTITYIRLENTHSREYTQTFTGSRFSLKEDVEGVMWKILCVGIRTKDPFERIRLKNETGRLFIPATNYVETMGSSKATKDGKVVYEGSTTSFFLAGPDNSSKITVSFGDSSVVFDMEE